MSLKLAFNSVSESARAVYSREQDLDWSPYGAVVFDVYNPTDLDNLRMGFVIVTGERELGHEAVTEPLKSGWNRDIRIDLTHPVFKCAASDYRPVGYLVSRGDVREVKILVYPGAEATGSVHLDNLRLERSGLFSRGSFAVTTQAEITASAGDIGYVSPEIRLKSKDVVTVESFEHGTAWESGEDGVVVSAATDLKSHGGRGLSVAFPASPKGFEVEMKGMEAKLAGTGQLWMRIHNAGRDVSVRLKMTDKDGEEYESERRKLSHGWNTIVFDFANANDWSGAVISPGTLAGLDEVLLEIESRYAGRLVIDGLSAGDLALRGTALADALVSFSYNPNSNFEIIADAGAEDILYGASVRGTRNAGTEVYLDGASVRADLGSVRSRVLYRRKINAFDNPVKSFVSQNSLGTEMTAVETSGRFGRAQMQAVVASQLEYDRYNSNLPTGLGPLGLAGGRVRYGLGRGWRVGGTWVGQKYRYGKGASGMPLEKQIWAADLDSYTEIGRGSLWWGAEAAVADSGAEEVSTHIRRKEPYFAGTSISPAWGRLSLTYQFKFDGYHFGGNQVFHWAGIEFNMDGLPAVRELNRLPLYDGSIADNLVVSASASTWESRDRQEDALTGKLRPRASGRSAAVQMGNDYQSRPNFYTELEAGEEEDPWYRSPSLLETVSLRLPLPFELVASSYTTWRWGWDHDKSSDEKGKGWSRTQNLSLERYFKWNLFLNGGVTWAQSRQAWEGEWGDTDRYHKLTATARQTVGASTVAQLSYGFPALFGSDYGARGTIDVWTFTLSTYF